MYIQTRADTVNIQLDNFSLTYRATSQMRKQDMNCPRPPPATECGRSVLRFLHVASSPCGPFSCGWATKYSPRTLFLGLSGSAGGKQCCVHTSFGDTCTCWCWVELPLWGVDVFSVRGHCQSVFQITIPTLHSPAARGGCSHTMCSTLVRHLFAAVWMCMLWSFIMVSVAYRWCSVLCSAGYTQHLTKWPEFLWGSLNTGDRGCDRNSTHAGSAKKDGKGPSIPRGWNSSDSPGKG